jgi:hypothetical protein
MTITLEICWRSWSAGFYFGQRNQWGAYCPVSLILGPLLVRFWGAP